MDLALRKSVKILPDDRDAEILRLRAQVEAKDAQIAALLKVMESAENAVYFYADPDLKGAIAAYTAWETANAK